MRSIRRILVAVKDPAAKALPGVLKAAQLGRALDAELVLFQAIGEISYPTGDLADAKLSTRDACVERLNTLARRLRHGGTRVTVSAQFDYPGYEAIIREAGRVNADLIVAERHTGRHLAPALLHLTDWELLRRSPKPVLLVKRPEPYRRPVVLAAVDPDHSYGKPRRLDLDIVHVGSRVATAMHGALHAVYAYVPVPLTSFANGATSAGEVARVQERSKATAVGKLQRALRTAAVPPSRRHVVGRHAGDAIVQVAADTRCAIVVMGAISRSGVRRLLIGNTAEKVLDHLPCDVLIVKPPHLVKGVPRGRRGARYISFEPLAL